MQITGKKTKHNQSANHIELEWTEMKQKYYGAPWVKQKKEITRRQNVQNFLYDYKISKIRGHPV